MGLSIREWAEATMIVICAVIGLAGWHEHDARLEAEGAALVYQDRADSLYLVASDRETALDAITTSENALIDLRTEERDSAIWRAARAEARRPAIIDRVAAAAGPDSAIARAAAQEVADSLVMNEIVPLRAALAAADSVDAGLRRELAAALAANASLKLALEASRAEADQWEKAGKTSMRSYIGSTAGIGIGVLVGLFLSR